MNEEHSMRAHVGEIILVFCENLEEVILQTKALWILSMLSYSANDFDNVCSVAVWMNVIRLYGFVFKTLGNPLNFYAELI
jgi:hypothetical protein